ncbi:MAG TPA: SgcJ/EcaC family oxidoreductase [Terriglobales bacterium]|nr:SgcJ/EcaC family oxidoreductase [Terriglobales bacterium]
MSSDQQSIRKLVADWLRYSESGEVEKILPLMAEDVIFLTPGNPPIRGRDAFAAGFRQAIAIFALETRSEINEISVFGDWAYCWSHLEVIMTPKKGGSAIKNAGNILSVLRKQSDGSWVLYRDANLLVPAGG